jgi:4-hydroxythreonine-4-phosphate dehydrogenase
VEEAGINRLNILNVISENTIVELGKPTTESTEAANTALARALDDLKAGIIDVLLISPSETDPTPAVEQKIANHKKCLKILTNDSFRLALATDDIPLSEIPAHLTKESLVEKITALRNSLIRDFSVTLPRIAVLGLNPGAKQEDVTASAIQAAFDTGVLCFGPCAADNFFATDLYRQFDAILAMYHDQGIISFKMLADQGYALFISNLPHIITLPNTPADFDKAGKNETSPEAFRKALYLAVDVYNNRKTCEEANLNPLKKQYFEHGSDNEKLDLTKDEF